MIHDLIQPIFDILGLGIIDMLAIIMVISIIRLIRGD